MPFYEVKFSKSDGVIMPLEFINTFKKYGLRSERFVFKSSGVAVSYRRVWNCVFS